jgi:hypothetical protein
MRIGLPTVLRSFNVDGLVVARAYDVGTSDV